VLSPDPQAEPPAAAALLLDHPAHRRLHAGGRAHRPLGVVLVRGGRAEHRHQPVAGELVDVPAELCTAAASVASTRS
jgi:hypothetical protein